MSADSSALSLLGGFLLTVAGERRDVASRKGQALICRLACDDVPVQRDALAALLWPDSAPAAARHSLRQALSELRRALGDSTIGLEVTARDVALESHGGSIDVREFRILAGSAQPADWARAMALYRGSLLEGLDVRVDTFDQWLDQARFELARTAIGLCRALAEHHADEVEQAILWNKRLLALDPLDEAVHRDLMQSYIIAGRDGAAIRQFLHCRSVLERELGIAPEPATSALYEGLLTHRRNPAASDPPRALDPVARRGDPTAEQPGAGGRSPGDPGREVAAAPEPARQLRLAVVFACHLTVDEADPEHADTTRRRQLDHVARVVRSYGGRVVAQVADLILCGFGLERTRGTEADRACLAGAELAAALPDLRGGIASGQVMFRPEEGSLAGQAVSDAQAMALLAGPGELRVSAAVTAARRYGESQRDGVPLVGRALEIRQFVALLDVSRDGGYGCALLLRGEAGIGKSRLLQEYAALAAREGFAVHASRAFDFGATRGEDALAQLVRSLLGTRGGSSEVLAERVGAAQAPYLQAVLGIEPGPEAAERLRDLSPLERLAHATDAVIALLRLAARDSALLLVVDDLHWADRMTLLILPRLAQTAAELPVVLVMTSRVAGEALEPEWRAAMGGAPLVTLDLQPLRLPEAGRLASALGADQERLAELLERAGGNPLFIQQLVRSGRLAGDLPHSIQSLAVAQLEALPAGTQRVVRAASVLGQQFSLAALEATVGEPAELRPALDAGLLTRGEPEWRFHHALIRDGIYQNLLPSECRALHARAAEYFRDRSLSLHAQHLDLADAPEAVDALVAAAADEIEHYRLALARQLVQRALAREPSAPGAMLIEAQLELMLGNAARAVDGFRACRRQAGIEALQAGALVGLGMALNQLDDYPAAVEALRAAVDLKVDDHDYQADAWLQLGNVLFPQGVIEDCLRAHQASLSHATRSGSTLRQARAEGGLGDAYYQQGAMLTAFRHFDRCVRLGEEHGHAGVVPANLAMRALTLMYQNRMRDALADGQRALSLARDASNLRHQLLAHSTLADVEAFHGDFDSGMQHALDSLGLGQRIGSRRFVVEAKWQTARLLWCAGRLPEARDALDAAMEILEPDILPFIGASVRGLQAACAASAGERHSLLRAGERLLQGNAVSHCHLYFYCLAIEACLMAGEHPQALYYAERLTGYTAREPLPLADFFVRRARLLAEPGSPEQREALVAEARAADLGAGLRLLLGQ